MLTQTKITLALVILIAYAFFTAVDVFADNRITTAHVIQVPEVGLRVRPVVKVWSVKHTDEIRSTCTTENIPTVEQYMDGDTDPATAYSDFLSDLGWWYELNPNACR